MEQTPDETLFNLQLDDDSGNQLKEAAKWSRFISIIYFVGIGLGVLAVAFGSTAMSKVFEEAMPALPGMAGIFVGIMVVVLIIFTWFTILLYRFATQTREGIVRQDQELFNAGIKSLKNYLTVMGVFTVLGLLFNILSFITQLSN